MSRRKRWLLVLALVMMVLSSIACNDDTTVGTVVEDTDSIISEPAEEGLDLLNHINCRLGFSTCVE